MAVKRSRNEETEDEKVVTSRTMTVALWEIDQPSGVLGFIELDNGGRPTGRTGSPMPLVTLDESSNWSSVQRYITPHGPGFQARCALPGSDERRNGARFRA
jgi:hypothetical protein